MLATAPSHYISVDAASLMIERQADIRHYHDVCLRCLYSNEGGEDKEDLHVCSRHSFIY